MTRREALDCLELPLDRIPHKDEVKAAYRRATMEHHPDLHPDDAGASARFVKVVEAYETLLGERPPDPDPSCAPKGIPRWLRWGLERAGDRKARGSLIDLLGSEDSADALQAGARAFLDALLAEKKGK